MKSQPVIQKYLEKHHKQALTGNIQVPENLHIIVVIPCYNEPDIFRTLQSLLDCDPIDIGIEVIVLINSYAFVSGKIKEFNRKTHEECLLFGMKYNRPDFRVISLLVEDLPGHQTGAGQPRKIGMDEAVSRFDRTGQTEGIILSLDADCIVEKNYFQEVYRSFSKYELRSATIEFHHPVEHLDINDPVRKASEAYELYLRYYRGALEYCGYPYAYYTIGSAIAVTGNTYARVGGMCKLQAGEDFYFMQKVFPLENTRFIDTTRVYPAARLSDRVPFGTGSELAKLIKEEKIIKYTYNFEAFRSLKELFDQIPELYKADGIKIQEIIRQLPTPVRNFVEQDGLPAKLHEINGNTSNPDSFRKRFFDYFNAFKILKYLNSVHEVYYRMMDVTTIVVPW